MDESIKNDCKTVKELKTPALRSSGCLVHSLDAATLAVSKGQTTLVYHSCDSVTYSVEKEGLIYEQEEESEAGRF